MFVHCSIWLYLCSVTIILSNISKRSLKSPFQNSLSLHFGFGSTLCSEKCRKSTLSSLPLAVCSPKHMAFWWEQNSCPMCLLETE